MNLKLQYTGEYEAYCRICPIKEDNCFDVCSLGVPPKNVRGPMTAGELMGRSMLAGACLFILWEGSSWILGLF